MGEDVRIDYERLEGVSLSPAFEWQCDKCGRKQFGRCTVPVSGGTALKSIVISVPIVVWCEHCNEPHQVIEFATIDRDEDFAFRINLRFEGGDSVSDHQRRRK